MKLAYIPEVKKIGRVTKYIHLITGGKYLIDIEGSISSFKSKDIILLDKEYTNQTLWHLAEFKLIPDGAQFKNNRGITIKFSHEKLVPIVDNESVSFAELYMHNDKWIYIETER